MRPSLVALHGCVPAPTECLEKQPQPVPSHGWSLLGVRWQMEKPPRRQKPQVSLSLPAHSAEQMHGDTDAKCWSKRRPGQWSKADAGSMLQHAPSVGPSDPA